MGKRIGARCVTGLWALALMLAGCSSGDSGHSSDQDGSQTPESPAQDDDQSATHDPDMPRPASTPEEIEAVRVGERILPPERPEPEPPVEMQRRDIYGAEEAARYYLELVEYVQETHDTDQFSSTMDPNCSACRQVLDAVVLAKSDEMRVVGRYFDPMYSRPIASYDNEGVYEVWVQAAQTQSLWVNEHNEVVEVFDPLELVMIVEVEDRDGEWVTLDIYTQSVTEVVT